MSDKKPETELKTDLETDLGADLETSDGAGDKKNVHSPT